MKKFKPNKIRFKKFWNKLNEEQKMDFLKDCIKVNKLLLEKHKDRFEESIQTARKCGVPEEEILKSIGDIDRYFLG